MKQETKTIENLLRDKIIPYDEAIKNPKHKNDITNRWRLLGLVQGIPQNSKKEKLVIEGFERMAIYLLSDTSINPSNEFKTVIFPLTRLIYTGEKLTGKRVHSIVMPEDLYSYLDKMTFECMEEIVKENTPKAIYEDTRPIFRLIEYKHLGKKTLTTLTEDDLVLTNDEKVLLSTLFYKDKGITVLFDFEAEITRIVTSCVVYIINKALKNEK